MKKAKKITSIVLAVMIILSTVAIMPTTVGAASSYTMPLNSNNLKAVGAQDHNGYACSCFALAYCRTILDGKVHSFSEYNQYGNSQTNVSCVWGRGNATKRTASNKTMLLKACYDYVNSNTPVVIHVNSSTGQHWVTVVGYQNVSNANSMSYNNLIIIDPWTGYPQKSNSYSIYSDCAYVTPNDKGSVPPVSTGNNPTGCVDIVESKTSGTIHIRGWAFDLDNPTKSLEMHVYIGGPSGNSNAEGHPGIMANQSRPDVANVYSKYNVGNNHGFDATIKTSKTGNQPVYIYAINIGGGNSNPLIGGKSYTTNIAPAYNPQGYLDNVDSPSQGKLHVRGWAFDKDNVNTALTVHIYVGGPAGSGAPCYAITANKERPDVNKVFAGVGNNHGYDETINVSKSGNQKVYAYALNIGGGTDNPNLTNSPKSVNIIPDTEKPVISNVTFSQVSLKGYRVTCNVSDNVTVQTVKFPSWTTKTDENGKNQDDLIWHVGTIDGNQASFYVKSSDHKNETGTYITHIYAYDVAGNEKSINAGTVTLTDTPGEKASTTYNGNKYTVYNSGMSWTEAKKWCEENGGHLAVISSADEWNAVKELLKKYNGTRCWLGAESTSGSWKWVTGEPLSFNDWDKGQPDCNGKKEFYLGTFSSGKFMDCYKWNDFSDSNDSVGGFVCELEKSQYDTKPITTKPNETNPRTDTPTEPVLTETTEPTTVKPVVPTVTKKPNPIKINVKTKTVKLNKLKKNSQTVKALTVKSAQGKVTYKLVKKGSTSKIFKLAKINSKGVTKLNKWKKAKKGTYKLKVKITAAGNKNYKSKTVNKVVKFIVQ